MVDKYLYNNAGVRTERAGTVSSAGAGDAGKIVALDPAGRIDATVLPVGVGLNVRMITTSEALAAGDFGNVHNVAGAFRLRKADASVAGKECHGFVIAAYGSAGISAAMYTEGSNTAVTSVTPGKKFLSTTAGGWTDTAPSGSGQVVQVIGVGVNANEIDFEAKEEIVLA